jgi:archaellum biogenesis ATPase FlaH
MSFFQSIANAFNEMELRKKARDGLLTFGNKFLDDAMVGIFKNDLILIGARSGAGKTQLCTNIALANVLNGKRVHYIALEAELYEIEQRIKYQLFAKEFYQQKKQASISDQKFHVNISYQNWALGDYLESHADIEGKVCSEFISLFPTLFTFYKTDSFDAATFMLKVTECANDTDLVIVDHVHYFDYEDDNENRAIKDIAKTARTLALENSKPIILVSHMRKADRNSDSVCPGLEEFHGSSDLFKIATKAITFAPGEWDKEKGQETYMRIVKNRLDGSVTRFMGLINYKNQEGRYAEKYKIGLTNQKRGDEFKTLALGSYPAWCEYADREMGSVDALSKRTTSVYKNLTRSPSTLQRSYKDD